MPGTHESSEMAGSEASHQLPLLRPGQTIRSYRIKRRIATGGMGSVYEATDGEKRVAIKVGSPEQYKRLNREKQIGARLQHYDVVKVLEAGLVEKQYGYIIMEYLEGETLLDYIRRRGGILSLIEALEIALQVASIMNDVHAAGLTHLDLKPANIMLCKDDSSLIHVRAKIIDFGLAHIIDDTAALDSINITHSETIAGTRPYMAPETWSRPTNQHWHSGSADVYSLGIMLYEMIAGYYPYAISSLDDYKFQHQEVDPAGLRHSGRVIPSGIEELVLEMLDKEPDHRPKMPAVVLALRRAVRAADALVDEPFPGLRPFSFGDARYFCGRAREVVHGLDALCLAAQRGIAWLNIDAVAGGGKTSYAVAGLLPALRRGAHQHARKLFGIPEVAICRVERRPMEALAAALACALDTGEIDTSPAQLEQSPGALQEMLAKWRLLKRVGRLVLLIDPLEGVLDAAPDERRKIDALLHTALTAQNSQLILLTTTRSDDKKRLGELTRLHHVLAQAGQYSLPALDLAQTRAAINEPAARAGLSIDPALAERVAQDSKAATSNLSLMAFTLRELWQRREGNSISEAAYEALGDVSSSLSKAADGVLKRLTNDQHRGRAELLLTALVQTRSGQAHELRHLSWENAIDIAGRQIPSQSGSGYDSVLEYLAAPTCDDRGMPSLPLLSIHGSVRGGKGYVTLSSIALLTNWESLRNWVERARPVLERWDEIEDATRAWLATENSVPLTEYQRLRFAGTDLGNNGPAKLGLLLSAAARRMLEVQRPTPMYPLDHSLSTPSPVQEKQIIAQLETARDDSQQTISSESADKEHKVETSVTVTGGPSKLIISIALSVSLSALAAFAGWRYWIEPADTTAHHVEPPVPVTPPAPVPAPPKPIPKPIPEPEPVPPPRPTPPPPGAQYEARGGPMAFVSGDSPSANVKPFLLDITEVTVNAYRQCVAERGCVDLTPTIEAIVIDENVRQRCNWLHADERANHPINCLNFKQAQAFCRWALKRIPTETEWLFATRGLAGRAFPWGDQPPRPRQDICWFRRETTCPVDDPSTEMDRSVFGIQGLAGNVGEFTTDGTETIRGIAPFRGGSYATDASERLLLQDNPPSYIKRRIHLTDGVQNTVGVRCAGDGQLVEKLKRIK